MARVPAAAEGGIKSIVNGPITFTPDANPLIGPAFGLRNAWLLTGSSMGIMEGGGAGKFLAHVNLGIIYNSVGDFEKSSINHQFALRYAIQMSSVAGQSVAIGNLGKVGGNKVYA